MLTNFCTVTMAMKTKTSLRNDILIGTVTMAMKTRTSLRNDNLSQNY